MSTYESLHRQCRTLESLFDTKLTAYARLASSHSHTRHEDIEASGSPERWKDVELEVEELLEKLEEANEQLETLSQDPVNPPSQSMMRAIQRHRDVYQDYAREFRRTKSNAQHALEQANLLTGVRNDINTYKSSAADALLAERGRIDSSHRMTDDILDQAYETRSEFSRQRTSLAGINTRMSGVLNTMPGLDKVVSMVKSRKRRDSIIMGIVIGICVVLLLTYIGR